MRCGVVSATIFVMANSNYSYKYMYVVVFTILSVLHLQKPVILVWAFRKFEMHGEYYSGRTLNLFLHRASGLYAVNFVFPWR